MRSAALGLLIVVSAFQPAPAAVRQGKNVLTVPVHLFWGEGCAHCEEERAFLAALGRKDPDIRVTEHEVLKDRRNLELLQDLLSRQGTQTPGVPVTFVGERFFVGFSGHIRAQIMKAVGECRSASCADPVTLLRGKGSARIDPSMVRSGESGVAFDVPFLGTVDAGGLSLPVLTIVIAGMDSFNPCAFFVLLSLLGLLVHARSRNRILLVGSVFVFFSGVISLLVMAAWLNLFIVMTNISSITITAGLVSLFIGLVNVKDFFAFRKGFSLSIPDSARPRLFDRMRQLIRSTSILSILAGTTVLAVMANFYELLCTAGFPIVFTRILTLDRLPALSSAFFLVLYNVIRVIPLFAIVLIFTITLGRRKLSERQGRTLKLVSGMMMLGLSAMLLVDPSLLNSLAISLAVMAGSIGISAVLAVVTGRLGSQR